MQWYRIHSGVLKRSFSKRLSTYGYFKGNSWTSAVFSGHLHSGEPEHSKGNKVTETEENLII